MSLEESPCRPGYWLVTTNDDKFISCKPKPCSDPNHIFIDNQCQHFNALLCPGFGEVWVSTPDGSATCECDSEFARGFDGNCHQLLTQGYRGYCKDNTIVQDINKRGLFVDNPCQRGTMPHVHSWSRFMRNLDDVTCHYVDEVLSECEVEINFDDELVFGSISIHIFIKTCVQLSLLGFDSEPDLVKSCVGDSCCGRRRRCVPIYF